MRKYSHEAKIDLRRPLVQYHNAANGLIVTSSHIFWFTDRCTNLRCCRICGIVYTAKEFKDQFVVYIGRQQELMDFSTNNNGWKNGKWDDRPGINLFTYDTVSDPGFNVPDTFMEKYKNGHVHRYSYGGIVTE